VTEQQPCSVTHDLRERPGTIGHTGRHHERKRRRMRTIGFLGGMSWESSAQYYRLANALVRDRLGGLHSARCILYSVDFADIEELQTQGRWEEAGAGLATAAQGLQAGGADMLVLCTNTMHKVADQIQDAISIPMLHLADTTADASGRPACGLSGCWVRPSRWSRTSTVTGWPATA
jgi:hypothetical protein